MLAYLTLRIYFQPTEHKLTRSITFQQLHKVISLNCQEACILFLQRYIFISSEILNVSSDIMNLEHNMLIKNIRQLH